MTILAFLQNMWFKDPDKARAIFARHPEKRNDLIRLYLFAGGLTGRRLKAAFGDLCNRIVWEECSPELGGYAASSYPPNIHHMKAAILKHRPNIVLCFGRVASDGLMATLRAMEMAPIEIKFQILSGPHPATRKNPMPALIDLAKQARAMEAEAL